MRKHLCALIIPGTLIASTATLITGSAPGNAAPIIARAVNAQPSHGRPNPSCNPTWSLVPTDALNDQLRASRTTFTPTGASNLAVDAVSPGDVWFPGAAYSAQGQAPDTLRWNGQGIVQAPSAPTPPWEQFEVLGQAAQFNPGTDAVSFDSPNDGWVVYRGNPSPSTSDDWAASSSVTAHWNGTRWTLLPQAPMTDPANTLGVLGGVAALSPTNAWAVGAADEPALSGYYSGGLIEHWNGVSWSVVPNPLSAQPTFLDAVTAISPTDIWAVGTTFDLSVDADVPVAEHYDGTSWQQAQLPSGQVAELHAVSATGPNDVWAVGQGLSSPVTPIIEHYDGTRWSVVTDLPDTSNGSPYVNETDAVYAATPTDVWATLFDGALLHFDGTSWTVLNWPGGNEPVDYQAGLGFHWASGISGTGPDDIWAVGGYDNIGDPGSGPSELRIIHLSCSGGAR